MRTILDLLHPNQPKPVVLNQHQDEQFNRKHGATPRDFRRGDKVYAKVYSSNTKWKWAPGEIVEVIGRVNHNVLLDEWHGRRKLIRSHTNQLKIRSSEETPTGAADSTPLGILVDMFGLQTTTASVPDSPRPLQEEPLSGPSNPQPEAEADVDVQEVPSPQPEEAGSSQLGQADAVPEPVAGPSRVVQQETEPQEDDQPPTDSIPDARPQRMIRMPSRFEPYWFWK